MSTVLQGLSHRINQNLQQLMVQGEKLKEQKCNADSSWPEVLLVAVEATPL